MEDQIEALQRRRDEWEVRRARRQRLAKVQFGVLLLAVIGSLFLLLNRQGMAHDAHPPVAAAPPRPPAR
jgi:hypothetical protein